MNIGKLSGADALLDFNFATACCTRFTVPPRRLVSLLTEGDRGVQIIYIHPKVLEKRY